MVELCIFFIPSHSPREPEESDSFLSAFLTGCGVFLVTSKHVGDILYGDFYTPKDQLIIMKKQLIISGYDTFDRRFRVSLSLFTIRQNYSYYQTLT